MLRASATAPTPLADRYLQQLCKHFAHKIPASAENGECLIEFPFGIADLQASDTALNLSVGAESLEDLKRMQKVVEDHLLRFAFREELSGLNWSPRL
ncbi:MAG: DUF2218 domain-containing protein [Oricola sp.]|nr:DUF2218 domain-containing protein [Oricola sp.]